MTINLTSLKQAKATVTAARKAATELQDAYLQNAEQAEAAWLAFLMPAHTFYFKMKNAVKHHPQARQWFGGKVKERREDPTLAYLHHARNDAEHGTEPITERTGPYLVISAGQHPSRLQLYKSINTRADGTATGRAVVDVATGETVNVPMVTFKVDEIVQLARVTSRDGKAYDPPTIHLGKKLQRPTPTSLSQLMCAYLERTLKECERFFIIQGETAEQEYKNNFR